MLSVFRGAALAAPILLTIAFMGCAVDNAADGNPSVTEDDLTLTDAGPGLAAAEVPCTSLVLIRGSLSATTSTACGASGSLAKSDGRVVTWRGSDPPPSAVTTHKSPFSADKVTKLEILVRFTGDDRTKPPWFWAAKNKNTGVYDFIDDNSWAKSGVSTFHTFNIPNPQNYVDSTGTIRIRLRSDNNHNSAVVDRMVVRVTGKLTEDDSIATTAAELFDDNRIPKFELTLDSAAIAVLSSTDTATQKTWVHGTFKYGNTVINNVGVRRKGQSTFRVYPNKVALKVKFDKYVDGQTFLGLTDLTLNNGVGDPTFLAERLSYYVFRNAGLPAQRANSARVFLNDQYFGLYVNVETPNDQFIARVFGSNANTLYEQAYGSEWTPGREEGFDVEVGDDDKADLTALFKDVGAARTATLLADVSPHLNTTRFLDHCAGEAAVGHYDGYAYGFWGSGNYFMAGDKDGVFSVIPWSTDLSFSNREGVPNANNPRPADADEGGKTLLIRCKESASCWATYKTRVQAMLVKFESFGLIDLAKKWHAQVDPHVLADTKREADNWYYSDETTRLYTWIAQRPGVVRGQMGLSTP